MTTLSDAPGAAGSRPPGADEPPLPSGTAVALEAAGIGLVVVALVVLLAWATDSRSAASTGEALRVAAQGWLLAHQVPLAVDGGSVGLVPGGLALLPILLLARAGAGLARMGAISGARDLVSVAGCMALPYAACAGVVALVAGTEAAEPNAVVAAVAAGAHALVAGAAGAALQARLLPALTARLPVGVREAGRAGLLALVLVTGVAALGVGVALAASFGEATDLARAVAPGLGGAVGLFLLGLALVPNAVVWGAAYLTGPGIALGAGSSVTVTGTVVAHVPALPLLAVLPAAGPAPRPMLALLLVPVVAGALAGRVLTRRGRGASRRALRRRAAGAAGVAGLSLGLLALLGSGPVGPGLPVAGASPWQVALALAAEVGLGALLVVEVAGWRAGRRDCAAERAGEEGPALEGPALEGPALEDPAPEDPAPEARTTGRVPEPDATV